MKSAKVAEIPRNRIPQSFVEAAEAFEREKSEMRRESEKRAWKVAYAAIAVAVIAISGGAVAIATHEDPEPLVMMVNGVTGVVEVLRGLRGAPEDYTEAVNKERLSNYVLTRAGYDWYTIGTDLAKVKLQSAPDVAKEYEAEVRAADAPLTQFKEKAKVIASIESVTFVGKLAQIRYSTIKQSTSGENTDNSPPQRFIATVAYGYDPKAKMTDQERLLNPLGFKVFTWRKDSEVTK